MSYFYSSLNLIDLFNRDRKNHFAIFGTEDKSISFKTNQTQKFSKRVTECFNEPMVQR